MFGKIYFTFVLTELILLVLCALDDVDEDDILYKIAMTGLGLIIFSIIVFAYYCIWRV